MNTLQLTHIAKCHHKLKKYFKGVYSANNIPGYVCTYPAAYIFNTHPKHKPGEHWVSVYFSAKKEGTYFDSFGLPPIDKRVLRFLQKNTTKWTYSNKVLQHPFSFLCGGFCIYFLIKKCQGQSLNTLLKGFRFDLDLNDNKIIRFLKRTFPTIHW